MSSITEISATDFSPYDGGNYQAMRGIASSSNGEIIYVSMNGVPGIGVMKSSNRGSTWTNVYPSYVSFTSIACSSDATIVYAANLGNGLYKSTNSGVTWNIVTFLPNNTLPGGAANPEAPGGAFPGYELTNIYQIACDSTGSKLIMTTNAAAAIYQSTDGGSTWEFIYAVPDYYTNPNTPTYVASNYDGTILYAALNNTPTKNIVVSKDSGVTWAILNTLGINGPFQTLATNSYGDFVFCISSDSTLNIFYPTHVDKALLVPSAGNTYVALACYNDGNNVIISQNNYAGITNGAVVLYSIVNKYSPGDPSNPNITCFNEDTKILTDKGYKPIQDLRNGDLIKTLNHDYKPIAMIGKRDMYHPASQERIKDQLYKCSQTKYPEIFEDLFITVCHSILVDSFTSEEQRNKTIEINSKIYITDNKYRLPACADPNASVYETSGTYTIYHLALEHDDSRMNYGIFANGLLVETCSKRYLKELSKMTLIE